MNELIDSSSEGTDSWQRSFIDENEYRFLRAIQSVEVPVGARRLQRILELDGYSVSESTLNRALRSFDARQLTRQVAGRGRVLTEDGASWLNRVGRGLEVQTHLGSLEIRTVRDVKHLLVARRAIEGEVARAVAEEANEDKLLKLKNTHANYKGVIDDEEARRIISSDFHRDLVDMCPNPILKAAGKVLFSQRFKVLEYALDLVRAAQGHIANSSAQHETILEAIALGDGDLAQTRMVGHLKDLDTDVDELTRTSDVMRLESILAVNPQV